MVFGMQQERKFRKIIQKRWRNPPLVSVEKSYTKTEINRMSTADLQKLANEQGFDKAEEISGADLKKMLIEKFGL